jgi:pimeloyl-ACP methyl ester carboxylesterase
MRHVSGMRFSLVLPLVLAACSSSSDPAPSPQPTNPDPPISTITWSACPLHSEGDGPAAECADVQMPLRMEDPNGETIAVHVKRFHPTGGASKHAVFMLQGGPGGSAYVYEGLVEIIAAVFPDIDWYLPDHRGTGKSTRLGCPVQESPTSAYKEFVAPNEWKNCLAAIKEQWGDKLSAFSTTNAAHDLARLIDQTRKKDQKVWVYGASYGTYWAHRYLQLEPAQADGVVLDSMAPPGMSLARQDEDANIAGKAIFAACGKDDFCKAKLGDDPWARAEALFAKLDTGHCAEAAPIMAPMRLMVRRAFGNLAMNWGGRAFIPATIYRLERCNAGDAAAVKKMLGKFFSGDIVIDEMLRQWSFALGNNISLSELWETPEPTVDQLTAIREASIVSRDVTSGFEPVLATWPRYTEPRAKEWAKTDRPLLMFAGGLDPATLIDKQRVMRDHFHAPNQHWFEFPDATHAILGSSPTKDNHSCGIRMMVSFFDHPESPDASCMSNLAALSFAGERAASQDLFGTDDAWE